LDIEMKRTPREGTVISLSGLEPKGSVQNGEEAPEPSATQTLEEVVEYGLGDIAKRPLFQRLAYPPRISLNGMLIGLLCTLLLVFIGFIMMPLPSPLNLGTQVASYEQLQMIRYTLQIPMMLFIAALLGPFLGTMSVFLYLAVGLAVYPVFANGGGWHYVAEPGFGYLLGAFVSSVYLGGSFHRAFQKEDKASRSLKLIHKVLVSVFVVHIVGILYLVGLSIAGQVPLAELPGWVLRLSVEPLPYDLLATAVLLCLVRQVRLALWIVLY
jgi:biotin transporter BioY